MRRLFVVEHDTGVVVELDQHDGAVDAVVERILVAGAADPREPRFVEVCVDLGRAHDRVIVATPPDVGADGAPEQASLTVGQRIGSQPLVRQHDVVLERPGLHAPVDPMLEVLRQRAGHDRRIDDRSAVLGRVERPDQVDAHLLLGSEDLDAGEGARRHLAGLRAHERRCQDDLVAEHETVDVDVVPVELPTPRLVGRRCPEDRDEVRPLAELVMAPTCLSQHLVEAHDVADLGEPAGRQRGAQHVKAQLALCRR